MMELQGWQDETWMRDQPPSARDVQVRPIRLLVFDLDGTLIDSSADLCLSVNAALKHIGREPLPAEMITSFIGDGAATLLQRALDHGAPDEADSRDSDRDFESAFSFFLDFYREHKLDQTAPYPGVLNALEAIRSKRPRLPMAVLTNKPVRPAREICIGLGLEPFFFAIYGGDSFKKKPHPEGLLALIAEANASNIADAEAGGTIIARDVVMIGDSPIDVLTARAAGTRSLGCSYGLDPEALAAASPDLLVQSAEDWSTALGF